jgi:regulator of replication initiation timing
MNQQTDNEQNKLYELMTNLRKQRAACEHQLKQIDENLQAVIKTVNLLKLPDVEIKNHVSEPDIHAVEGKTTQIEAIIALARNNNGIVNTSSAKSFLIKSGLMKNTKNASTIIYTNITRSGKFERITPGQYRLLDTDKNLFNNQ